METLSKTRSGVNGGQNPQNTGLPGKPIQGKAQIALPHAENKRQEGHLAVRTCPTGKARRIEPAGSEGVCTLASAAQESKQRSVVPAPRDVSAWSGERDEARLLCHHDGRRVILTAVEVRQLEWRVNLAWLVPISQVRYRVGTCASEGFVPLKIKMSAQEFLFALLSQDHPLRRSDFVDRFPHMDDATFNAFSQRAHHIKDLFTKEKNAPHPLLESVPTLSASGVHDTTYRVRPGISTLLVVRLAPDVAGSGYCWHDLADPPPRPQSATTTRT